MHPRYRRDQNKKNSRFAGRAKPEPKYPDFIQIQLSDELNRTK
jgi:hypothetical protein